MPDFLTPHPAPWQWLYLDAPVSHEHPRPRKPNSMDSKCFSFSVASHALPKAKHPLERNRHAHGLAEMCS